MLGYRYEGFWAPMDTLKDKHILEALIRPETLPGGSGRTALEARSADPRMS